MNEDLRILTQSSEEQNTTLEESEVADEVEYRRKSLLNDDLAQNIALRRRFSWAIYYFVISFVTIAVGIVLLCGIEPLAFHLSDAVLIALLTTMTTTIVGLLVFVVKYFFPQKTYK